MYSAAREGRDPLSATQDTAITAHLLSGRFSNVANPISTLEQIVAQIKKQKTRARLESLDTDSQRDRLREVLSTRKQVD